MTVTDTDTVPDTVTAPVTAPVTDTVPGTVTDMVPATVTGTVPVTDTGTATVTGTVTGTVKDPKGRSMARGLGGVRWGGQEVRGEHRRASPAARGGFGGFAAEAWARGRRNPRD